MATLVNGLCVENNNVVVCFNRIYETKTEHNWKIQ